MRRVGILLLVLLSLLLCACGADNEKEAAYIQAQALFQEEKYDQAADAFVVLGAYKDSQYLLKEAELARDYGAALALLEEKDYAGAYVALCELGNYKDVLQLLERFQKVLLTEENWDRYYEPHDELDWSEAEEAETGGYSGLKVHCMFRLKEEYSNNLYAPERNTLMAGLKVTHQYVVVELNEETGTYVLVDYKDPGYTKQTEVQGLEDGRRAIVASERVARSLDEEGLFDYYLSTRWAQWDITSFSGELYIYQG